MNHRLLGILPLFVALTTLTSCSIPADQIAQYIDYKSNKENYLLWTDSSKIQASHYLMRHTDATYPCYTYYGLFFFWHNDDEFIRFDVTVFFDRKKSAIHPLEDWSSRVDYYNQLRIEQIHFNFLELKMRQFRKELTLEPKRFVNIELNGESEKRFNEAVREWKIIESDIYQNLSADRLKEEEIRIKSLLNEMERFGPKANFY